MKFDINNINHHKKIKNIIYKMKNKMIISNDEIQFFKSMCEKVEIKNDKLNYM